MGFCYCCCCFNLFFNFLVLKDSERTDESLQCQVEMLQTIRTWKAISDCPMLCNKTPGDSPSSIALQELYTLPLTYIVSVLSPQLWQSCSPLSFLFPPLSCGLMSVSFWVTHLPPSLNSPSGDMCVHLPCGLITGCSGDNLYLWRLQCALCCLAICAVQRFRDLQELSLCPQAKSVLTPLSLYSICNGLSEVSSRNEDEMWKVLCKWVLHSSQNGFCLALLDVHYATWNTIETPTLNFCTWSSV